MLVNFFAPINNLGYGQHAYNTIREFEARQHEIVLIPPLGHVYRDGDNIKRWLANQESFDIKSPSVMIFNEEFLAQFSGAPRIGFPVFEMEKFTPLQLTMMKSCDAIFTPTKWAKNVLEDNGISGAHVVNEGYDPFVFPHFSKSISETGDLPFTFAHIGKFEERKGTIQAIECFTKALENKTARLFMAVNNPLTSDYTGIVKTLEKYHYTSGNGTVFRRLGLSIHFMETFPTQDGIASIFAAADCGLFPSRAEGWGLPILEAIATGVPTIVGNWTGQSEYLSDEETPYLGEFLLNADKVIANDNMWFRGGRGTWNVPTDDNVIEIIRFMFEFGRTVRQKTVWLDVVKRIREFTWARAAEQLETAIGRCR